MHPALSKSSRWSFVGMVFHCMITATPSIEANALRRRKRCVIHWRVAGRMQSFFQIVRQPFFIVGKQVEAALHSLEFVLFSGNIGDIGVLGALAVLCRLVAIM
jgi:hypothetical protein